jgi:hypothetical protein
VHDAERVGVVEGDRDVGHDPRRLGRPEDVAAGNELLEVTPFDVLHGDVHQTRLGVLADVVDGDDPGVVEPPRRPRLAHEALAELVGELGVEVDPQGLERHQAVDDRIAGEIDDPHRPPAEGFFDLVATDLLFGHRFNCIRIRACLDAAREVPLFALFALIGLPNWKTTNSDNAKNGT